MNKLILAICAYMALTGIAEAAFPLNNDNFYKIEIKEAPKTTIRGTPYHNSKQFEMELKNINGKTYITGYDPITKMEVYISGVAVNSGASDEYKCFVYHQNKYYESDFFTYSDAEHGNGSLMLSFEKDNGVILHVFGKPGNYIATWVYYE